METYTILSVELVDGNTLNRAWRSPMQKVTTNHGVFIDNKPLARFGANPPGSDWEKRIGQTVRAKVTDSSGFKWISLIGDDLTTTSALAKIHGITTDELKQKLVYAGYLEVQGDEHTITLKGKAVGGRRRVSKQHGPCFVWPRTIEIL